MGSLLCGWVLAHQGQAEEGLEQMHQGLRAFVPPEQNYMGRIFWRSSPRSMGPWDSQRQDSRCSRKR